MVAATDTAWTIPPDPWDLSDAAKSPTWRVIPEQQDPNAGNWQDRHSQRSMREVITVWMIALLCIIIGLAFTGLFLDDDVVLLGQRFVHLKTLLDVLVGPVVTLLSSVIGFYFGTQATHLAASAKNPSDH